jgi:hypothetical protein
MSGLPGAGMGGVNLTPDSSRYLPQDIAQGSTGGGYGQRPVAPLGEQLGAMQTAEAQRTTFQEGMMPTIQASEERRTDWNQESAASLDATEMLDRTRNNAETAMNLISADLGRYNLESPRVQADVQRLRGSLDVLGNRDSGLRQVQSRAERSAIVMRSALEQIDSLLGTGQDINEDQVLTQRRFTDQQRQELINACARPDDPLTMNLRSALEAGGLDASDAFFTPENLNATDWNSITAILEKKEQRFREQADQVAADRAAMRPGLNETSMSLQTQETRAGIVEGVRTGLNEMVENIQTLTQRERAAYMDVRAQRNRTQTAYGNLDNAIMTVFGDTITPLAMKALIEAVRDGQEIDLQAKDGQIFPNMEPVAVIDVLETSLQRSIALAQKNGADPDKDVNVIDFRERLVAAREEQASRQQLLDLQKQLAANVSFKTNEVFTDPAKRAKAEAEIAKLAKRYDAEQKKLEVAEAAFAQVDGEVNDYVDSVNGERYLAVRQQIEKESQAKAELDANINAQRRNLQWAESDKDLSKAHSAIADAYDQRLKAFGELSPSEQNAQIEAAWDEAYEENYRKDMNEARSFAKKNLPGDEVNNALLIVRNAGTNQVGVREMIRRIEDNNLRESVRRDLEAQNALAQSRTLGARAKAGVKNFFRKISFGLIK